MIDELEKIESIKPALQTAFDKKRTYALRHRILDVEKQIDDANNRINKMHAIATKKNSLFGGRLILVDLAGADSDSRSIGDDGHTLIERKESQAINKSLLALKECIRALTTSSQHNSSTARKAIPFRNSSLTRVLEEVLTPVAKRGSRSVMLVNIGPEIDLKTKTINSLRYGQMFSSVGRRRARQSFTSRARQSDSLLEAKRKMKKELDTK